jgi:gliding motility-associated-like protein
VFLSVFNQFGCTDSTVIYIQIKGDEIFYVPNTFTPDGDEFNNIFTPVFTNGFDPANFQMDIYNRWGELIFQSFNAEKGWDGYFNGKLCTVGTYTWKITYKNPEDDAFKLVSGHVNLIE